MWCNRRVTFLNSELFLCTLHINAKALTGLSVRSSQRKRSCSHAVCERVFLTKLSNSVVFMSNTSSGAVVLCRLAIPARLSCCFRCLHGYFSKLALLTRSLHKEPFANHIFDIGLQAACNLQGYCRESFQMQMTKYSPNFSITYWFSFWYSIMLSREFSWTLEIRRICKEKDDFSSTLQRFSLQILATLYVIKLP